MQEILKRLQEFEVIKIDLKENHLKLQIKLKEKTNLKQLEEIIKQRFPEYILNILFFMEEKRIKNFKKIIGITSGKGGVGKSMVALNLALALNKMGKKVALLDADIYAPSIPLMLNLNKNPESIDGNLIEPILWNNIEILSMGLFLKNNQSPLWKDSMIGAAFRQFLMQGNWQSEYLIIDFAASMNETYSACYQLIPNIEFLLVATPHKIVYSDVLRMYALLKSMNFKIIGAIDNMAYSICKKCHQKQEFQTNYYMEGLQILYKLPKFDHFYELIEKGYNENYEPLEEFEYFKEILDLIL